MENNEGEQAPQAAEGEAPLEGQTPETETPKKTGLVKKHYQNVKTKATPKAAQFKAWYLSRKKLSIPLSIVLGLALITGIPYTRYAVAGIVLKQKFSVQVLDANTRRPITNAAVSVGGVSAQTDNEGKVLINSKVGSHKLKITKKYYKDIAISVTVPITKQKSTYVASITATGRQVPVSIVNKISGKAAENITIKAADGEFKTDKDGKAIVVVPADKKSLAGTITGDGFNETAITLTVTDEVVAANTFGITPAGKVYFLSKLSGKIDVVKTNLDGTARQTVIAGTGKEEQGSTILLASRDWKYLALLSRRDSDKAKLYLIETASDKLSVMDEGNANFTLSGWSDSTFVYSVNRTEKQYYEAKYTAIKSFNADTKKLTTLAENASEQTPYTYFYQNFSNIYLAAGLVIYNTNAYRSAYGYSDIGPSGLTVGIYSVKTDGSDKKTLKSLAANFANYQVSFPTISSEKEGPQEIEFTVRYTEKYIWDHGVFKDNNDSEEDAEVYHTYLESPSGKSTFWYEPRDGKNTLLVGDNNGKNGKTVTSLNEYVTYGWYGDNYLLVSKGGSELFILPTAENVDTTNVLKISDYHKPNFSFNGYGGGYGGL